MLNNRRAYRFLVLTVLGIACLALGCKSKQSRESSAIAASTPASETKTTAAPPASAPASTPPPQAAVAEPAPSEATASAIVAAPANIRDFSPRESNLPLPFPADRLDLRKVFEELGEDTTLWYQHVQTLANPFFGGRQPGSRGDEIAVEYIEYYFKLYGLEPAFPSESEHMGSTTVREWSSYRQSFDFGNPSPDVKVHKAQFNIGDALLADGTDFVVLGNTGNGKVTGPITFVGYGIAEGRDGYTSFDENTDLTGRIALVMRYEPLNEQGKSQWSQARFSTHSAIAAKFKNLVDRGAAGIILVNPPGAVDGKTSLETINESRRFGARLGVPAVQVSADTANRLLGLADSQKRDLMALRQLADKGDVKTVTLADAVQVTIQTEIESTDRLNTWNVAGVLRGKGTLADEWIVIGGHYDHVGYGYTGAMPQNIGKLHPGADDNASGTASVLIAARRLSQAYAAAKDGTNLRSVIFMGFGAEEAGLHGSRYFVENPPVSLGSINLMFNLDMVGRLRNNNLMVQGTGTAEGFSEMLKPFFEASGMTISASPGGRGPSDHSNFYGKNIPVLFLFTGTHNDYHRPSDYAYTVNPAGALKIVDMLEKIALHFVATPERLRFQSSTESTRPARETGARVTLGTMPDYGAELETGMRVDDVRQGSSAAEAGIQAGDVLLTWNGEEIAGPRSIAEFLAKHNPGDVVKIVLRRGSQEIPVDVRLRGRPQPNPQQ